MRGSFLPMRVSRSSRLGARLVARGSSLGARCSRLVARLSLSVARDARAHGEQVSKRVGTGGAGRTERNWTVGGIVGASVIATLTLPRSHVIVQSPRSAF